MWLRVTGLLGYTRLRSIMNTELENKDSESAHPQLAAIRDSLLSLHKQTSTNDFSADPTGRINILDEIVAICAEQRAILKAMTIG